MRKLLRGVVFAGAVTFVGALAGPASANHDHQLNNPSGCVTIPVGHQAHGATDPGRKFHGAAHKGAATVQEPVTGHWVLGQGNSQLWVDGGSC